MININVADKLAELGIEDEVLLKKVRELASYAFEQGQEVGNVVGKKSKAMDDKREKMKDPNVVVKKNEYNGGGGQGGNGNDASSVWVDDKQNLSNGTADLYDQVTADAFYGGLVEFRLTIADKYRSHKRFEARMELTKTMIRDAISKQQLFDVVITRLGQGAIQQLTDQSIERNLL